MKRVFISTPYRDVDRNVVEERIHQVQKHAVKLLKENYCPVAPILLGDPIVVKFDMCNMFETWKNYCLTELDSCDIVHVLQLDGWHTSPGVLYEIDYAISKGKDIVYITKGEMN